MKTSNNLLRYGKWTVLILAVFMLALSLTGCGTPEDEAIEAFRKAENGYNADSQNAVARYGGLCDSVTVEYADGSSLSYDIHVSSDNIVVAMEEGWYYLCYEDEWYCYFFDEDGNPCYSKYITYDEVYELDPEYANPGFTFDSDEDQDITLVENKDGSYTWTSSAPFDNGTDQGTSSSTVYLNADYEITGMEGTYYLADGSVLLSHTDKFSSGVQNDERIAALVDALEKADGQTRHLTYNAVEDGVVIEALEIDVPEGFYCTAVLPPEYYDAEESIYYFTDIGLTQEYTPAEPYGDLDIYFSATHAD